MEYQDTFGFIFICNHRFLRQNRFSPIGGYIQIPNRFARFTDYPDMEINP